MNLRVRLKAVPTLTVLGLALLSVAAGMLVLVAGVAAAGVSCIVLAWLVET